MRLVYAIIALVAATVGLATPATAQSLGQILGTVTGLTNTARYSGCSYQSGIYAATCQIDRARQLGQQIEQARRSSRSNDDFRQVNRSIINDALVRACQAGDQDSCQRSRQVSTSETTIANALMSACRSGDDRSCARARQIREQGYRPAPAYTNQRAQNDQAYAYSPVRLDPRTGRRILP